LRHHRASASEIPARLLYSARTHADLIYRGELADYDTTITLTREQPQGWSGRSGPARPRSPCRGRLAGGPATLVYLCGPTGFVEGVADAFVSLGHEPSRIRAERFGPTTDQIVALDRSSIAEGATSSSASTSSEPQACARPTAFRRPSPRRSSTHGAQSASLAAARRVLIVLGTIAASPASTCKDRRTSHGDRPDARPAGHDWGDQDQPWPAHARGN